MKKSIAVFILLATLLGIFALTASASTFGIGVSTIANDVKLIKTGLIGKKLSFSDTDFKTALGLTDFERVKIITIPSSLEGTLTLAGRRVGEGQTVSRRNIASLSFMPASKSVTECRFTFAIDECAGGAEIECILKFTDKINYAPSTESKTDANLSVWTQMGVSVYGNMSARDPENDKLEFIIVAYPERGSISVLDEENGEFRYTPATSYTGSDKFTYVVRDEWGNFSEPTEVSIRVAKRQSAAVYTDMLNSPEYNAALVMTGFGVMSGVTVGDQTHFKPNEEVTRAEFVAMALKCAGIRADSTLGASYFDDNDEIPSALMGYVATAQRLGIINGSFDGKGLYFRPNDTVTQCEAAIILANLVGVEKEDESVSFSYGDSLPVWAKPSVYTMYSLGIFETGKEFEKDAAVTRGECAEYLFRLCFVGNK